MPGILPNTNFAEVTVNSSYTGTSVSMDTGKVQRLDYGGHYYDFSVRYPSLTMTQAKEISGFLAGQRGSLNNFDLTVPTISVSEGAVEAKRTELLAQYIATPERVDFNHYFYSINLNNNSITYRWQTQGEANEVTDPETNPNSFYIGDSVNANFDGHWFNAGDYINFNNHVKTYQIVSSVNPVWIGTTATPDRYNGYTAVYEGSITLSPDIVLTDISQWVQNTTIMNYRNVAWRVFLVDTAVSYAAGLGDNTSITLNLREET
jgi:hypothetical protein